MKNKENSYNYQGLDLSSISPGYRKLFKGLIDQLFENGCIGEGNSESSQIFFDLLKRAGSNNYFDQVLKNFLEALNLKNIWILRMPDLFGRLCQLGTELADHKLHMGNHYFCLWGEGGFGDTQEAVAYLVGEGISLMGIDKDLCYHFIANYRQLGQELSHDEIDAFLDHALVQYKSNPKNAIAFLQLKTRSSKEYLKSLARAPRLTDIHDRLRRMLCSISGADIGLYNLTNLNSHELTLRQSRVVTFRNRFYIPGRIGRYTNPGYNTDFYLFCAVVAGSSYAQQGFSCIHGSVGAENIVRWILSHDLENPQLSARLLHQVEVYRILQNIKHQFPGLQDSFKRHLSEELKRFNTEAQKNKLPAIILRRLLGQHEKLPPEEEKLFKIINKAAVSKSVIQSLQILTENLDVSASTAEKILQDTALPFSFFPDYFFRTDSCAEHQNHSATDAFENKKEKPQSEEVKYAPEDKPDLQDGEKNQIPDILHDDNADLTGFDLKPGQKETGPIVSTYLYDEWNDFEQDYYENWCCLRELRMEPGEEILKLSTEHHQDAERIKRMFQRLKPDLVRKEKYLPDGDSINMDLLVEHLSTRKAKVCSREKFYEKQMLKKRDLTVAILMDMSGSTRDEVVKGQKVIDLEKESTYILAEGLSKIGDRFGIFGFSGYSRENAEYFIFKDFTDKWAENSKRALLSAIPRDATRMGVPLRHTGWKLSQIPSRKKIIILISDGKPADSYYDSASGYAHYDVRMANLENYRKGIDTFCISTEENLVLELEIMFPFHRYVVIRTMQRLPHVLSRLYLKLTK